MLVRLDFNKPIVDDRGEPAQFLGEESRGTQRFRIKSKNRPAIGNFMLVDEFGRVWSPGGYTQVVRNS